MSDAEFANFFIVSMGGGFLLALFFVWWGTRP